MMKLAMEQPQPQFSPELSSRRMQVCSCRNEPMDLRKGILMAVDKVVEGLRELAIPIRGREQIANVATISANGDKHIGDLIAGIFDRLGANGTITVSDGKTFRNRS